MKICSCKINHLENPVGYELSSPRISWTVEDSHGKKQVAARIRICLESDMEELIYDTDWKDLNPLGERIDICLKPRTRYYYTVAVRSDADEETVSEVCFFETAKENEKWEGKWITCKDNSNRSPIFSKKLGTEKEVKSARLYITGLGLYEAFIDGKKIGDEYLTPYCNDYDEWIQYQTYDVTDYIKPGSEIAVILGNGWYKGRFGFDSKAKTKGYYGNSYLLLAELRILYEDGKEEIIGTDDSWKVEYSNILFSNIYDGEERNDNSGTSVKKDGEKAKIVTSTKRPKAVISARYSQPVKTIEERKVKKIRTPKKEIVLDVGQSITGSFRLKVSVPKGKKIKLSFGEVLQDGNFYNDNLRSAKAEYIYTSDGEKKTIQPHFTFYGYRYVKVEGYDEIKTGDFTAIAFSTVMEETGSIETGNELINKLISNIKWGCRDNFVDVPTDCPQRDERMGWTADTQVFSPSATYMLDSYAFYRKYLHDMAKEQKNNQGGVPYTIPAFGMDPGSSVWGDAATIIPWMLYKYYGDDTILKEQYDSMRGWVDFMTLKDGDNYGWRKEFHFGDWLALDVPGAEADATSGATDKAFIADVYYMHSAEIVADTALLIGRAEDGEKYRKLALKIRDRIKQEFYSPNDRCCCDTQTGLILTLRHHLAKTERTAERLRVKLRENNYKLDCGFVGAPMLCMVLAENGMDDIAGKLLLNEEFPGWLHEIKLGATTVWERWNSLDENGHISSTGMNSLNHYAYGSILEWMYAHLAGIKAIEPGFSKVALCPKPIGKLGYLSASYRSAAGIWKSSWEVIDDNNISVSVTVPFGTEADLYLPLAADEVFEDSGNPMFSDVDGKICHLNSGSYSVTYKTKEPITKRYDLTTTLQVLMEEPDTKKILFDNLPAIHQTPADMRKYTLPELMRITGKTDEKKLKKIEKQLRELV